MINGTQWNELTAQQLVRYEALFKLLDEIQSLEDIEQMLPCWLCCGGNIRQCNPLASCSCKGTWIHDY
jgi:hypothetical protein